MLNKIADDMNIIARTFGTVAELYTRLKRKAAKVGLVVNASKTNYMLVGGTENDRIRLGSNVTIDGDTFEVVEEFVYLGSLLTADNNVSREIRRRIISGSRAYYGLQKKLRSKKIPPRTKCIMYNTLYTLIMFEEDLQALRVRLGKRQRQHGSSREFYRSASLNVIESGANDQEWLTIFAHFSVMTEHDMVVYKAITTTFMNFVIV